MLKLDTRLRHHPRHYPNLHHHLHQQQPSIQLKIEKVI
jgi:hypothetical protein